MFIIRLKLGTLIIYFKKMRHSFQNINISKFCKTKVYNHKKSLLYFFMTFPKEHLKKFS